MANNADQNPCGGVRLMNKDEVEKKVSRCSHIAEKKKRGPLNYYHHSLVLRRKNTGLKIIHYGSKGLSGKVQEDFLAFDKMDFELGVYLIHCDKYPQSPHEKDEAIKRARSRLGETNYMVTINNCEHFVTWALTGTPVCHQMTDATTGTVLVADLIDGSGNKKEAVVGIAAGSTTTDVIVRTVVNATAEKAGIKITEQMVNEIVQKALTETAKYSPGEAAIKMSETVSKILTGSNIEALVAVQKLTGGGVIEKIGPKVVASSSSAKSVLKQVGVSSAFGVLTESIFLIKNIYDLNKSHNKRTIDDRNFKRGVATSVVGSAGSVVGGVIGQLIIPVPVVGGIIGSLIVRGASSLAAGLVFDKI